MPEKPALPALPPAAAELVHQMESLQALGASRNLQMILRILTEVAETTSGGSPEVIRAVNQVADYFIATRGQATQTIPNALRLVLMGLPTLEPQPDAEVRRWVARRCSQYASVADGWSRRIAGYGAALLRPARRILAYDYSSTVVLVLKALAAEGCRPTVIIPESRNLMGGRPIVKDLAATGLPMEFVPDCAIGHFTATSDAVLVGCETAYASGAVQNTIGSAMTALVAHYHHVPVYVPTTLIKLDARSLLGQARPIPERPMAETLLQGWGDEAGAVTCPCPELDMIPAEHVTAFVTEEGVLPPQAMWTKAERFLDRPLHGEGEEA